MTKKYQYNKKQLALERAKTKSLNSQLQEMKAGGKKGKLRYFTRAGGINVAVKSNLSCTPASALGCSLEIDIHRTTVTRWEGTLDACLRASSKTFYDDSEAFLHDSGGYAWHVIRSDATNAKIWQKQKLHVCQVESFYLLRASDTGEELDTSLLADLMVVNSSTGVACRAMIRKQCR